MRKLSIISIVLALFCLASCEINRNPVIIVQPTLSAVIESDPEIIVAGQWVEFEVVESLISEPENAVKQVFWTVNGNTLLQDYCFQVGNVLKAKVYVEPGVTNLDVKVEVAYYAGSGSASASRERSFTVVQPDVHQFLWGTSMEVVEDNIRAQVVEKENALFYPQVVSEYWTSIHALVPNMFVSAEYQFDNYERLIKLTEAYVLKQEDTSDFSYQRITYQFAIVYYRLSHAIAMQPLIPTWSITPTAEQTAALNAVLTDYSSSTDEQKIIVGKAIANDELSIQAESTSATNTLVRYTCHAGEPGSVDFMMRFTPRVQ